MSPRRKVDSAERFVAGDFFAVTVPPRRRRGLTIVVGIASLVMVLTVAGMGYLTVRHEQSARTEARSASVLGYVREFMKGFTSIDPYHANAYVDRIQAQGTGEFAKKFKEKTDDTLLQVARAQPTAGTVEDAGVQRWNDDGSADVLIAMKVTTTTPDGKATIESGNRWVVTASQEGQQWKISRLNQVI
jgi:Mce-associated membrane protein